MFSVTVLRDERIVVVAEQRPDSTEEDSFQWMSRVLQVPSLHVQMRCNAALLHLDQVLFEMSFSCGYVGHCVRHLDRVLCLVRLTPLRYVCIVLDYSQQSELPHGDVKSHLQSDQTPS